MISQRITAGSCFVLAFLAVMWTGIMLSEEEEVIEIKEQATSIQANIEEEMQKQMISLLTSIQQKLHDIQMEIMEGNSSRG